jgi:nucleoside-diphosphate-sugar epimerase
MARNLVTGGFGFIGSYLLRQLLEDGEAVVIFQRRKIPPQEQG